MARDVEFSVVGIERDEGGERFRNGFGRDFLKKSLRDAVSEGFRLKNLTEREKTHTRRFIWSNPKKSKSDSKSGICSDL